MKHLLIYILLFFGVNTIVMAQIDVEELEQALPSAEGEEKYDILYQLSKAYIFTSPKKSIKYGEQAFDLAESLNDKNKQASALNIIGTAYYEQKKYRLAVKNYEKEYEIRKTLSPKSASIKTLFNLGSIYEVWGKESKAAEAYKAVLEHEKKNKNSALVGDCYEKLIYLYGQQKKYKEAYTTMQEYLGYRDTKLLSRERKKIAILETNIQKEKKIKEKVETQYNKEKKLKRYAESKYRKEKELKEKVVEKLEETDSSLAITQDEKELLEVEKQVLVQDTAYKSNAITDLSIEKKQKEEEVKRQRQWITAFAIFLGVIFLFSVLLFKLYKDKQKVNQRLILQNAEINEQKEEIKSQADELIIRNKEVEESREEVMMQAEQLSEANEALTIQRDEIQKKNRQITDSITYASKIQHALLPTLEEIKAPFADTMLLFIPRNIVSGDFYWYKKINKYVVFVAADCTGHGVPGAFMSMLGISFLNNIFSKDDPGKANDVLDQLRERVKSSLNQTEKRKVAADGMDMTLCILDTETNKLQFAGANNPLYLIRDKELHVYKADMQPISIFIKEKEFTNHEISLQEGDVIYVFSDGYLDQFGGQRGQKFKAKRFNELLLKIHDRPMKEQQTLLERTLDAWMQDNYTQLDDILILGIKI